MDRGHGKDRPQIRRAVQMRVHRHHPVDGRRQKPPDDPLADRLAWMKGDVLTHVAQIGRDQFDRPRPAIAQRRGGQQQVDQPVVRAVQRTVKHRPPRLRHHPHKAFAIGKAVARDGQEGQAHRIRQPAGRAFLIGKGMDGRPGHLGIGMGRWSPSTAKPGLRSAASRARSSSPARSA